MFFIVMYCYIYVSSYELLVHPYVHVSTYVFLAGIYLLFICYLFCSYVLFVNISVICMCIPHRQECGLYVSFTKHTILIQNSKFAGCRVFLAFHLFVCLCVLCVMSFLVLYHLFFFHLLCTTVFPPFVLWFAHFLWFDLGFCVNFWGVGSIVYVYI